MNVRERITEIITEDLASTDCFLVGVDTNQAETDLKFFIDGKEGVNVQVCTRLSRKISRILDEEYLDNQSLRYEISSPGVDQPLVDKRQYVQHIGRELEVCTNELNTLEGVLISLSSTGITLSIASKQKKEERTILFENIKSSIVKISFKPRKK